MCFSSFIVFSGTRSGWTYWYFVCSGNNHLDGTSSTSRCIKVLAALLLTVAENLLAYQTSACLGRRNLRCREA